MPCTSLIESFKEIVQENVEDGAKLHPNLTYQQSRYALYFNKAF